MHMRFWEVTDIEGQSFFLPINIDNSEAFVGPFFAIGPPDLDDTAEPHHLAGFLGGGDAVFRAVDRQALADVMMSGFGPIYPACVMLGDFPIPITEKGVTLAGLILGEDGNPWRDVLETWGAQLMLAMNTKLLCDVAAFNVLH